MRHGRFSGRLFASGEVLPLHESCTMGPPREKGMDRMKLLSGKTSLIVRIVNVGNANQDSVFCCSAYLFFRTTVARSTHISQLVDSEDLGVLLDRGLRLRSQTSAIIFLHSDYRFGPSHTIINRWSHPPCSLRSEICIPRTVCIRSSLGVKPHSDLSIRSFPILRW